MDKQEKWMSFVISTSGRQNPKQRWMTKQNKSPNVYGDKTANVETGWTGRLMCVQGVAGKQTLSG